MEATSERLEQRYNEHYKQLNKLVKQQTRTVKGKYLEELARQGKDAALKSEHGTLYKITSTISGKHSTANNVSVKDKCGKLIISLKGHEERWAEHYKQLLNRNTPTTQTDIIKAERDLDIHTDTLRKEEIIISITGPTMRKLQSRKA